MNPKRRDLTVLFDENALFEPAVRTNRLLVSRFLSPALREELRSVNMPPHDQSVARRTIGLEAALVDNDFMTIPSLDPADTRTAHVRVAGPAALLVAKLHKLGERVTANSRMNDKTSTTSIGS